MKTLFKIIKMLMAVVFGLFIFLFIAIWVTEPKKQEIEYAQQDTNPQVETIVLKQDAVQQQQEMKVKEKTAKPQEDPETFMRRVADKGDKQISINGSGTYIDIRACPSDKCDILATVTFVENLDLFINSLEKENTKNGVKNWVKANYYGDFCDPKETRDKNFCKNRIKNKEEITGWVDFSRINRESARTFKQWGETIYAHERLFIYRLFEATCNPSGIVVSNLIEENTRYYLIKYYNEQSRKEIEDRVRERMNKQYRNTEEYCAGELPKYLEAQQIWEQSIYRQ